MTETDTASTIVWFELPAQDSERAQRFYGQLFGWRFEAFGEQDYHLTHEGDGAVHGALDQRGLLASFGVADIEAARRRVAELGGDAGESEEMPGIGRYARCTDTEGNAFGLYEDGGSR